MKKFIVNFTKEVEVNVVVEAKDAEHAEQLVIDGEYDFSKEIEECTNSVDIIETWCEDE